MLLKVISALDFVSVFNRGIYLAAKFTHTCNKMLNKLFTKVPLQPQQDQMPAEFSSETASIDGIIGSNTPDRSESRSRAYELVTALGLETSVGREADSSFDPFSSPQIRRSKSMTIRGFGLPRKRSVQFEETKNVRYYDRNESAMTNRSSFSSDSKDGDTSYCSNCSGLEHEVVTPKGYNETNPITLGLLKPDIINTPHKYDSDNVGNHCEYNWSEQDDMIEDTGTQKGESIQMGSAASFDLSPSSQTSSKAYEERPSTSTDPSSNGSAESTLELESSDTVPITANEIIKCLSDMSTSLGIPYKGTLDENVSSNDKHIASVLKLARTTFIDNTEEQNNKLCAIKQELEQTSKTLVSKEQQLSGLLTKNNLMAAKISKYESFEKNILQPWLKAHGTVDTYNLETASKTMYLVTKNLEQEVVDLKSVLENRKTQYEQEKRELQREVSSLKKAVDEAKNNTDININEPGVLKRDLEAANMRINAQDTELSEIKCEYCKVAGQLQAQKNHIVKLQEALTQETQEKLELNVQVQSLDRALKTGDSKHVFEKKALELEITKAKETNNFFKTQLAQVTQDLEGSQAEAADFLLKLSQLEAKEIQSSQLIANLQSRVKTVEVVAGEMAIVTKANQILVGALMHIFESSYKCLEPMLYTELKEFYAYLLATLKSTSLESLHGVATLKRAIKFLLRAVTDLVKLHQLNEEVLNKILSVAQ